MDKKKPPVSNSPRPCDTPRTRDLKDLRRKRLAYYDSLSHSTANKCPPEKHRLKQSDDKKESSNSKDESRQKGVPWRESAATYRVNPSEDILSTMTSDIRVTSLDSAKRLHHDSTKLKTVSASVDMKPREKPRDHYSPLQISPRKTNSPSGSRDSSSCLEKPADVRPKDYYPNHGAAKCDTLKSKSTCFEIPLDKTTKKKDIRSKSFTSFPARERNRIRSDLHNGNHVSESMIEHPPLRTTVNGFCDVLENDCLENVDKSPSIIPAGDEFRKTDLQFKFPKSANGLPPNMRGGREKIHHSQESTDYLTSRSIDNITSVRGKNIATGNINQKSLDQANLKCNQPDLSSDEAIKNAEAISYTAVTNTQSLLLPRNKTSSKMEVSIDENCRSVKQVSDDLNINRPKDDQQKMSANKPVSAFRSSWEFSDVDSTEDLVIHRDGVNSEVLSSIVESDLDNLASELNLLTFRGAESKPHANEKTLSKPSVAPGLEKPIIQKAHCVDNKMNIKDSREFVLKSFNDSDKAFTLYQEHLSTDEKDTIDKSEKSFLHGAGSTSDNKQAKKITDVKITKDFVANVLTEPSKSDVKQNCKDPVQQSNKTVIESFRDDPVRSEDLSLRTSQKLITHTVRASPPVTSTSTDPKQQSLKESNLKRQTDSVTSSNGPTVDDKKPVFAKRGDVIAEGNDLKPQSVLGGCRVTNLETVLGKERLRRLFKNIEESEWVSDLTANEGNTDLVLESFRSDTEFNKDLPLPNGNVEQNLSQIDTSSDDDDGLGLKTHRPVSEPKDILSVRSGPKSRDIADSHMWTDTAQASRNYLQFSKDTVKFAFSADEIYAAAGEIDKPRFDYPDDDDSAEECSPNDDTYNKQSVCFKNETNIIKAEVDHRQSLKADYDKRVPEAKPCTSNDRHRSSVAQHGRGNDCGNGVRLSTASHNPVPKQEHHSEASDSTKHSKKHGPYSSPSIDRYFYSIADIAEGDTILSSNTFEPVPEPVIEMTPRTDLNITGVKCPPTPHRKVTRASSPKTKFVQEVSKRKENANFNNEESGDIIGNRNKSKYGRQTCSNHVTNHNVFKEVNAQSTETLEDVRTASINGDQKEFNSDIRAFSQDYTVKPVLQAWEADAVDQPSKKYPRDILENTQKEKHQKRRKDHLGACAMPIESVDSPGRSITIKGEPTSKVFTSDDFVYASTTPPRAFSALQNEDLKLKISVDSSVSETGASNGKKKSHGKSLDIGEDMQFEYYDENDTTRFFSQDLKAQLSLPLRSSVDSSTTSVNFGNENETEKKAAGPVLEAIQEKAQYFVSGEPYTAWLEKTDVIQAGSQSNKGLLCPDPSRLHSESDPNISQSGPDYLKDRSEAGARASVIQRNGLIDQNGEELADNSDTISTRSDVDNIAGIIRARPGNQDPGLQGSGDGCEGFEAGQERSGDVAVLDNDYQEFIHRLVNDPRLKSNKQKRPKSAGFSQPTKSAARPKSANSKKTRASSAVSSNSMGHSADPDQYYRKWQRSSLAWSSYNSGELSKPSSLQVKPSRGAPARSSGSDKLASASRKSGKGTARLDPTARSLEVPVVNVQLAEIDQSLPSHPQLSHIDSTQRNRFRNIKTLDTYTKFLALGKGYTARLYEKKTSTVQSPRVKISGLNSPIMSPRVEHGEISLWECLPDELLLYILSYLNHRDLASCARTCKLFHRITSDNTLWRKIVVQKNPNLCDLWLKLIGQKQPNSLSLIQCNGAKVTAEGLRELFRHCSESLQELDVTGCSGGRLTGDHILLHAGSRCSNISSLDVSWCGANDNGVMAMSELCDRLESLSLNGCQDISDQLIHDVVLKHGQHLRVLELFGCFGVTSRAVSSICTYCHGLVTLNLGQCWKLTDNSIMHLTRSLTNVENLDLRGCKLIKDTSVHHVVRNCKKLRTLALANCPNLTDVSLGEIATYCPSITSLDVCGCRKMSNSGVKFLATSCQNLEYLDLSSTGITHNSVSSLASYCNDNLEVLKVNFCKDIPLRVLVRLVKNCKRLKKLYLYGVNGLRDVEEVKRQNRNVLIEM